MSKQQRRRSLAERRNRYSDRIVVACATSGEPIALVQVLGAAPARLVTLEDDVLLQSVPIGYTVKCRCIAGRHAIDILRLQAEVFRQSSDPTARRPLRIMV